MVHINMHALGYFCRMSDIIKEGKNIFYQG